MRDPETLASAVLDIEAILSGYLEPGPRDADETIMAILERLGASLFCVSPHDLPLAGSCTEKRPRLYGDVAGRIAKTPESPEAGAACLADHLSRSLPVKLIDHHPIVAEINPNLARHFAIQR